MSLAKIHRRVFWLGAILLGCASWNVASVPCDFAKTRSSIPVLVAAADPAVADGLLRQLLSKLKLAKPQPPIDLKTAGDDFTTLTGRGRSLYSLARPAMDPRVLDTEALRDLGIKEQVALVLWSDKSEWLVVLVRAHNESLLGFPAPKATRLPSNRIAGFLRSFAHYYYGDAECALNGFNKLEASQRGKPQAAAIALWTASTLDRLGQNDKAISHLRVTMSSLTSSDEGLRGSLDLALGLSLLPRAAHYQNESKEIRSLLEEAARVFNEKDKRNWAASQIALGRYWLLTSGRTSSEGLLIAQRYFDQAEPLLVFPLDAAEWANLQSLMGMTQLQLGMGVKDSDKHFANAAEHFQAARAIWTKLDNEVEVEAISHQLRYMSDLRRRTH